MTTCRKSCILILTGRRVFTGTITSYESGSTSNYNPFRYAGYYYDGNTGLYYLINRYYNPAKGRFMSEDPYWNVDNMLYGKFADDVERQVYYPAVRQSWNRYAYCMGNPVRWRDHSGESIEDIIVGFYQTVDNGWFYDVLTGIYDLAGKDISSYSYDDKADYYLGRMIGDAASLTDDAWKIADGLYKVIDAVKNGAAITVATGGTGVVIGVVVAAGEAAVGVIEITVGVAGTEVALQHFSDDQKQWQAAVNSNSTPTSSDYTKAAKELGYEKTNMYSHGQPVYYNSKTKKYITPDVDSHNGGTWKMADSVRNLGSKRTRIGTFDMNLNKIGD